MKKGLAAAVVMMVLAGAVTATPIQTVTLGDHTISLLSANVEKDGKFVWTYKVKSGSSPAISHWVLGICLDHDFTTNERNIELVDGDPHFGLTGVKFEDGYRDNETRYVKLYFDTEMALTLTQVDLAVKAGRDKYTGTIYAPGCTPGQEIPEPTTLALVGAGLIGLTARRRRNV
jgi:hypothetical protein